MITIKVIIGSTRPSRQGPKVAKWLMSLSDAFANVANFEVIDLQDINLPLLDEPEMPATGKYSKDHTKMWAAIVDEADAYVIVHPEYNHSVNSALKNALDYVWHEWNDKPVALVSYGGESGGTRAAQQLRTTASALRMYDIREQLVIANFTQYIDESGKFNGTPVQAKVAKAMLTELIFWAQHMKTAREQRG
jgi:NAD(P)H-dependent FMN reductase